MQPATDSDRRRDRDLDGLARGGAVSFGGSVLGAVLNLALLLVVTWGFGTSEAGIVFEVVALFNIATVVTALGADTALLRFTARDLAHGTTSRLRRMTLIATVPPLLFAGSVAVAMIVFARPLGRVFAANDPSAFADFVRIAACAIPVGAVGAVVLGGTRGFSTMAPTALLERIARPALQTLFLLVGAVIGAGWMVLGGMWALATPVLLGGAWVAWTRLGSDRDANQEPVTKEAIVEFWSFSLPRAFASMFRVGVLYLDVLLVGALIDSRAAAIYTVATRLLQIGFLVNNALGQAVEPIFSRLVSTERHHEAQRSFEVTAGWGVALTWPWLITISIFASTVLGLFGADFATADTVLVILAVGGMIGVATGPVDVLLVMAGRSGLSFWNSAAALATNVVLNVVLIPVWGLEGAALAWVVSLLVSNLAPLVQVHSLLGYLPVGPGWLVGAGASLVIFGVAGVVARTVSGDRLITLAAVLVVTIPVYLVTLWRERRRLDLSAFTALRPRRRVGVTR